MFDSSFIVLDTEGNNLLSEIAILNSQGKPVYEAFAQGHARNQSVRLNLKPLTEIVRDVAAIAFGKSIVCHYAMHDLEVLQLSFKAARIPWFDSNFICTWELAKQYFPQLSSYSLEYLSKHLNLKVDGKRFNPAHAHTARYDTEFTYQLYIKILERQKYQTMQTLSLPNPFSSSRVDTPFQKHVDFREIYQTEFELLKSILGDIKTDPNQQSQGAVIIGEAGSGKTHLIMRLAQELLRTNRLLFIRQPNNADTVLYHIYSRILESFAEIVPGSNRTQLELLIANSFVNILSSLDNVQKSQKGREILTALQNDSLILYGRLGAEETQKYRDSWNYIERNINDWWTSRYTAAGYSTTILKGIVKFCSYNAPHLKNLVRRWLAASELEAEEAKTIGLENWQADVSREEFALEAISVFGKLSILDEPLLLVFDQLEALGFDHNANILTNFGLAIKEILTHVPNSLVILNLFPDRWEQFKGFFDGSVVDRVSQHEIRLVRPSNDQLDRILNFKAASVGIKLSDLFEQQEVEDILQQNSIRSSLNRASAYFRYKVNNVPLPPAPPILEASIETRVQQLEGIMRQIADLVSPYQQNLQEQTGSGKKIPGSDRHQPEQQQIGSSQEIPGSDRKLPNPSTVIDKPVLVNLQPLDRLLTEYLQQQKAGLDLDYGRPRVIDEADDIGKLANVVEAFKTIRNLQIEQLRLGRTKLPEHLMVKTAQKDIAIGFLHTGGNAFTTRIKSFNQLTITYPKAEFRLIRDAREPRITGAVGKAEIEKLKHSDNGTFIVLEQEDRVQFELVYKLITDIQEKDLEVNLVTALPIAIKLLDRNWLVSLLCS